MSCLFIQGEALDMILSLVNIINRLKFKKEFERRSFAGFRFLGNQVGNFLSNLLSRCIDLKPTLT
jgi:hypothetical protein